MRFAFSLCNSLIGSSKMNDWDVSNVTTMRGMFFRASTFNQPLGNWNVANVRDMRSMFSGAASFNQPLGNWNDYQQVNSIQVFNAMGAKLLESKSVTAQGLDISHLSPGLHMVKMMLSDGTFQETKLIISR